MGRGADKRVGNLAQWQSLIGDVHDDEFPPAQPRTAARLTQCPSCGCGAHSYHERDCVWAKANDPSQRQPLSMKDLIGKQLSVIDAEDESITFAVSGEPDEVYEICESESQYEDSDGGMNDYKDFSFSRVKPESIWPRPSFRDA